MQQGTMTGGFRAGGFRTGGDVALSLAALGLLWSVLALLKADETVLPGPMRVLSTLSEAARSGPLLADLAATLRRVAIAFALAMSAGTVLGLLLGRHPLAARFAAPWTTVFLNMPALVVIIVCYLWIGLNELAALTAVTLSKTAMVLVTMRQGAAGLDPDLDALASVYRLGRWQRLRHVTLPQLVPWFAAAARNGLAVIWKIVLIVEFLGRSDGIGFRLHLHFQQFETAAVLAYALSFVLVMLAAEHLAIAPLERRAGRWRNPA
jgi:NitT/TauT family transport system permease protein